MKKIGLWMYTNDNGKVPKTEIIEQLKINNNIVIDFDMRNCYIQDGSVFSEKGECLDDLDVVYHMNADHSNTHQTNILKYLEWKGVKVINDYFSYTSAKDKAFANFLLKNNGILVPPSLLISSTIDLEIAKKWFEKHNTSLLKPTSLHGGKGIIKVNNFEEFIDLKNILDDQLEFYYLEKYIDFGKVDYRVEVFNNEVVGWYSRKKNHSFKTNITSGGEMIESVLKKEHEKIALKCSKVLGLTATIIDLIEESSTGETYVLEANPIMGIFVESALAGSKKHKALKEIPNSFKTDSKKISKIINLLSKS